MPPKILKVSSPEATHSKLVDMDLAVTPPVKPMLAKALPEIPRRDDLSFEPKWDGFRCIVFKDGDEVFLGSRNEKPLTRYFPELIDPFLSQLPEKCVIDGELILIHEDKLRFEMLQQRIHPAESRVVRLSKETPASFVGFDILCMDDLDLRGQPFSRRREILEGVLYDCEPPIHLTPTTTDTEVAMDWFERFEGAGLDGLIMKPQNDPYVENKRSQFKLKHVRTADAVVAGFRWHKDGKGVGSLVLGIYDGDELRHVGVASSFTVKRRTELVEELKPYTKNALEDHPWQGWAEANVNTGSMPGVQHRWAGVRDSSWVPLRPELVVEVKYGSTLGGRFREVTRMLRWRTDKEPADCKVDQFQEPTPAPAATVLKAGQ